MSNYPREERETAQGALPAATEWRTYLVPALVAGLALIALLVRATVTSGGIAAFNDFYREAWPSYRALDHGHILGFIDRGPAYLGSLVLRAPFAFIPSIWGGGPRAAYIATAIPCLLSVPILASWLIADTRGRAGTANPLGVLVLYAFNPIVILAIFGGHPEEVLGAVLCVAAVLAAARDRAGWATAFLSLAVINKFWALVAVPVVIAVLPRHRLRVLIVTGVVCAVVLIPLIVEQANATGTTSAVAGTGIGTIFNSAQLLWWFGRTSWIVQHARDLIVVAGIACAGIWWFRGGRNARGTQLLEQALLLLALVMLLRAALDPWDNAYYHLPFLFALLAYETYTRRWPLLTFVYSFVLVIMVPVNGITNASGNTQALAYALISIPLILWLASRLFLQPSGSPDGARSTAVAEPVADAAPGRRSVLRLPRAERS